MTPNRKSSVISELTVKINVDMEDFMESVKQIQATTTKLKVKDTLERIDECRKAQKEILNSSKIGSLTKGFICNNIEETIESLKQELKSLVDEY